ncbi:hypothetical protein PFISCL1PPCAC_9856, partial [Pristionchus fissidentatus]
FSVNMRVVSLLLCCLTLATAYSTRKEPKMPEVDDSADYGSPVAHSWPLGRDPTAEEQSADVGFQKQREAAQIKIEAILKSKMAAAHAARDQRIMSPTVPALQPTVLANDPSTIKETRPLGFDVILNAGEMVKRIRRFLNEYEQTNPQASEQDWMVAFLDEIKSIDQEDDHILTDRMFTILKEKRAHH